MNRPRKILTIILMLVFTMPLCASDLKPVTTIHSKRQTWTTPSKNYAILQRGEVEIVVVNNQAVDDNVLPGHRAGYSGIAKITHKQQAENLFVPSYAGLNYEHIHDGKTRDRKILFEPRNLPMQLRQINEQTVELYQAPAGHYRLESCQRYELLENGTIQLTYECTPRANSFTNHYIGLFWASYIHQPKDLSIHFPGFENVEGKTIDQYPKPQMVRGVTPQHGIHATHRSSNDQRLFQHDSEFPLSLVFGYSRHRFQEPWYYGVSGSMGFAQIFRDADQMRISQSPSGGGQGNPAWDFQYFVPDYEVGKTYRFVMRAVYHPIDKPAEFLGRVADEYAKLNAINSQ